MSGLGTTPGHTHPLGEQEEGMAVERQRYPASSRGRLARAGCVRGLQPERTTGTALAHRPLDLKTQVSQTSGIRLRSLSEPAGCPGSWTSL
jgi:hypothetical protein